MFKVTVLGSILAVISLFGFFIVSAPSYVEAQASIVCDGLESATDNNNCGSGSTSPSVKNIMAAVLNILSLVAGVIAVIMIIIAGTKFMTSQGDSGKVASARSTIIFALVGLIIVGLSQSIVFFVLKEVSPPPVTTNSYILSTKVSVAL